DGGGVREPGPPLSPGTPARLRGPVGPGGGPGAAGDGGVAGAVPPVALPLGGGAPGTAPGGAGGRAGAGRGGAGPGAGGPVPHTGVGRRRLSGPHRPRGRKGWIALRMLSKRLWAVLDWLGLLPPGKVMYIGGSDTLPAPLKREEEARLIALLEQGDSGARDRLIEHNLRLVAYIARRFE